MENFIYISFSAYIKNILTNLITDTIKSIADFEYGYNKSSLNLNDITNMDLDGDDQNDDVFAIGKKVRIDIADMDYKSWRRELERDKEILDLLLAMIADITPAHDSKLQTLFDVIDGKQEHPINTGNKKIIIFTAFADTANYLYDTVSVYVKKKYGLDTAINMGNKRKLLELSVMQAMVQFLVTYAVKWLCVAENGSVLFRARGRFPTNTSWGQTTFPKNQHMAVLHSHHSGVTDHQRPPLGPWAVPPPDVQFRHIHLIFFFTVAGEPLVQLRD